MLFSSQNRMPTNGATFNLDTTLKQEQRYFHGEQLGDGRSSVNVCVPSQSTFTRVKQLFAWDGAGRLGVIQTEAV